MPLPQSSAMSDAGATAFIALGANLGDRHAILASAASALDDTPGIVLEAASWLYETAPVGGPEGQDAFLNAVVRARTTLAPLELLDRLLAIEEAHRRVRVERWGPRTLDLDLLFLGDSVLDDPRLILPHPRLHQRRFVLAPLADIGRDVRHPALDLTVAELLAALPPEDIDDVRRTTEHWR